ncbi:MAG: hypothetical protein OEQ14_13580 [Gammaproteobacteria bacterium]|nr:hypothetical protein [Gammaproteobacteria bacterium]
MGRVLPAVRAEGGRYCKYQRVHARPAIKGEVVISVTEDGEETRNTAAAGDVVVRNLTEAQEEYLVDAATFAARYRELKKVDELWKLYDPIGEILAIEISQDVTSLLGVAEEFYLMAPWGTRQKATVGDFFVAPLPELDKIYRVAKSEFEQTYELVTE